VIPQLFEELYHKEISEAGNCLLKNLGNEVNTSLETVHFNVGVNA
jgi:hypothetical protein